MKATGKAMRNSRRLRRTMTPPEVYLWQHLRHSPAGIRFRRQYAVGPYVADFYCPAAKLVIELDGTVHDGESAQARDAARASWLCNEGFRVIRIPASDVLSDSAAMAGSIVQLCLERPAPPPLGCSERSPSPSLARQGG